MTVLSRPSRSDHPSESAFEQLHAAARVSTPVHASPAVSAQRTPMTPGDESNMSSLDTKEVPYAEASPVRPTPLRGTSNLAFERYVLLGSIDILLLNLALMGVTALRLHEPWGPMTIARHPMWYGLLTLIWLAVALLLDAYNLRRASALASGIPAGAVAALLTGLVYLSIPYVTPALLYSRLSVLSFLVATVGAVSLWRAIYPIALSEPSFRKRAIIVGAGLSGRTIREVLRDRAPMEYEVLGFLDDDAAKQGAVIDGLRVLGTRRDLHPLIRQTEASEVILAITQAEQIHPELLQAILDCHERGIRVTQMALLYEQLTGRVAVEHAGRNLSVVLPLSTHPTRGYRALKWAIDMALGIVGLLATAMLFPIVSAALRFESQGPVLYKQVRIGRGGRTFRLIKFRTMVADAEVGGPQWAQEHDERTTRAGRLLRRLHLDEIPQAINILRGDLSFIGPRPERPEFVAQLEKQIPFYRARHAVKPGITGWAQVNYGYGASIKDALIKLQYDLYYIKRRSIWLDLLISIKTIPVVLTFNGW